MTKATEVGDGWTTGLHHFIDSWFPPHISERLHRLVPILPHGTIDDLNRLIAGEGLAFEGISSQRIAVTCLRRLGELILGEPLVLIARAEIELTHSCNFHCAYCPSRPIEGSDRGSLGKHEVESLIKLYHRAGCRHMYFNGGEVSLLDYVPDLVRLAASLGMQVGISSNGSGSVEFYRQLVDAGLSYAHISFDSCFPQAFEKLTSVAGSWNKINSTLAFLCGEAKRINPRLLVVANLVLTEETLRSLPSTTRHLINLGVDDIKIMPAFSESRTLDSLRHLFRTSIEPELRTMLATAKEYPVFLMRLSRLFSGKIHGVEACEKGTLSGCDLQVDQAMVRADGVYAPCFIYMAWNYRAQDYGIGSVDLDLSTRSELARKSFSERYSLYPTCASRCPDFIRDGNGRIQAVVSDCIASLLRSLHSEAGLTVGEVTVRCENLLALRNCAGAGPVPDMFAIPYAYAEDLDRILLALAEEGLRMATPVTDLKCANEWRSGSPIVDFWLRVYSGQSEEGRLEHFLYRAGAPSRVDRHRIQAALTRNGVVPRCLRVSVHSQDVLIAQARIVIPPFLTCGTIEERVAPGLPCGG